MNYPDKSKKELLKDLTDLQKKYDTISLLYETEKSTLAALVENNSDVMLVKDCNRRIIAGNSAFLVASGYKSLEEIIGKTDAEILNISENSEPAFSYKQEDLKALQLSQGQIIQREENFPVPNGGLKTFLTTKFPIFINQKLIGIGVITSDITKRKQTEQFLLEEKEKTEESEEKYRFLIDNINDLVCEIDENGVYTFVCSHYKELLGYEPEELIGKNVTDLIHPEDLIVSKEKHERIKNTFEKSIDIWRFKHKNGEYRIIESKGTVYTNSNNENRTVVISRDITEQKALEDELKEKTSFLSTIMETSPVGIVIVDKDGSITYANNRAEQILGLVKEEITSRTYDAPLWKHTDIDGSPFPDEKQPFNIVKKTLKTVFDIQHGITWPDGRVVLLSINATPIKDNNGNFNGMIASIEDITERKKAEKQLKDSEHNLIIKNEEYESINEELKQTNEELIIAKQKAEESDRLKTAFLQNISHEIRTPLNAICGFSGMLNKPKTTGEKRNSFISIIQTSSNQLLSIISDVLAISALETKQEKISFDKVCTNNIIVDLLSIFKPQSINQNISLYAKQPLNDKQSEIYTDKTKITQILSNLISNALKFTHEGFIEFGYNLRERELEFYVKDSGVGIKKEQQDKIFERFRQADLSINKKYGGTGLGLSISKGFVELLGGKIWVNSEIDKGSTFYFTIPYKPVNEIDKTKSDNLTNSINNKPTILVAEDEEFNFLYIEELLIDFDYKLIHAKDGQETVDIFKTNPDISLILMDIKMPIMDGHTAAKLIKEIKPDLQIIAQSAYALEHEIEKYSGIFDDYLTKPIKEDILIDKVTKHMNNK